MPTVAMHSHYWGRSPEDVWLSVTDAAARMRVSRTTIYKWVERGVVTTRRTAGGTLRILERSLWREPEAKNDTARQAEESAERLDAGVLEAASRHRDTGVLRDDTDEP